MRGVALSAAIVACAGCATARPANKSTVPEMRGGMPLPTAQVEQIRVATAQHYRISPFQELCYMFLPETDFNSTTLHRREDPDEVFLREVGTDRTRNRPSRECPKIENTRTQNTRTQLALATPVALNGSQALIHVYVRNPQGSRRDGLNRCELTRTDGSAKWAVRECVIEPSPWFEGD
jgi:hypothetical protein